MLGRLTAVRFDRRMASGKSWPCQLAGLDPDGDEKEVVAKFSDGCERKVAALAAEAIAAMLAADLDLPVPEPHLVSFDDEFIDLIPEAECELVARMRASVPVAFGSTKLPPGFSTLPRENAIPRALRQQAVEIFVFDELIQNPDRRPENPNCLLDGNNFAIFDHELTFVTEGIIGWQPPWEPGSLWAANGHVFFPDILGRQLDLRRLKGAWEAISDNRLGQYRQALPTEWNDDNGVADSALEYLAQVRENLDPVLAEIERVLA